MKTYSLAEVAAIALPKPPQLKDPERWLRRHLNNSEIRGYKTGRIWRLTEAHLEWLVNEYLSNTVAPTDEPAVVEPAVPVSILAGMSERARARILRDQGDSRRLA